MDELYCNFVYWTRCYDFNKLVKKWGKKKKKPTIKWCLCHLITHSEDLSRMDKRDPKQLEYVVVSICWRVLDIHHQLDKKALITLAMQLYPPSHTQRNHDLSYRDSHLFQILITKLIPAPKPFGNINGGSKW